MEKMNTTKKIAVVLAVLMVAAAIAAPAVMGANVEYSATVRTGQDTTICAAPVPDGAFGEVLVGKIYSITPSFALNNTGDWDAIVEAAFGTNGTGPASGIYGLVGTDTTNVIPGTAFKLEASELGGAATALTNTSADVTIPPNLPYDGGCYNYSAHLDVPGPPSPAAQDIYTGNVVLAFSNV